MMKKNLLIIQFLIWLTTSCFSQPQQDSLKEKSIVKDYKIKAGEAKKFCASENFNLNFCILADMSLHSGQYRIFVWDFQKDTVVDSGICSHGCGNNPWGNTNSKENPTFSNVPESHCSSLGKYKIGKRGYSQWGINVNYLLHGLESSNSNALKRTIVLHSWEMVPENEVYPAGTPEGWGCPAVSNEFMKRLDNKLNRSEKPVLLWMFNE